LPSPSPQSTLAVMTSISRSHVATLRGMGKMATDAATGLTELVQALHTRIAKTPTKLGGPLVGGAVNGVTDLVYAGVRGVTRAVGGGLDVTLAQLSPFLAPTSATSASSEAVPPARTRQALIAALNGVLGDYLADTENPLEIRMAIRRNGVPLVHSRTELAKALGTPRSRVVVLLHGLCMSDLQWERAVLIAGVAETPHGHGAQLERDLGCSSIHLNYNSGQHISTNGRLFAEQLESLISAWPVAIESLDIIGHSMGGLVARSALHYGTLADHAWTRHVRRMVFLGSPHHGSPLERGGHWIDVLLRSTPYTDPFSRLGRVRSAGITDLRHGSTLDEDWHGRDRFAHGHDTRQPLPLPDSVSCHAIAATTAHRPVGDTGDVVAAESLGSQLDAFPGDGLVPVASALGRHTEPRFMLNFPPSHQWVAWDTGHLDLLSSKAVYQRILQWLGG
jgi:pimeloyl-ACP methyl ester carboxylesterase